MLCIFVCLLAVLASHRRIYDVWFKWDKTRAVLFCLNRDGWFKNMGMMSSSVCWLSLVTLCNDVILILFSFVCVCTFYLMPYPHPHSPTFVIILFTCQVLCVCIKRSHLVRLKSTFTVCQLCADGVCTAFSNYPNVFGIKSSPLSSVNLLCHQMLHVRMETNSCCFNYVYLYLLVSTNMLLSCIRAPWLTE